MCRRQVDSTDRICEINPEEAFFGSWHWHGDEGDLLGPFSLGKVSPVTIPVNYISPVHLPCMSAHHAEQVLVADISPVGVGRPACNTLLALDLGGKLDKFKHENRLLMEVRLESINENNI